MLYRVNDKRTIANCTFMVGGELDLASNPGSFSWEFEAKPDQGPVGWYETLQLRAAASRVVLILIIAEVFNDCCTLYE